MTAICREPRQTCALCQRSVVVTPDGRGFPPDIARRKLEKICRASGCECNPQYTAGLVVGPRPAGQGGDRT